MISTLSCSLLLVIFMQSLIYNNQKINLQSSNDDAIQPQLVTGGHWVRPRPGHQLKHYLDKALSQSAQLQLCTWEIDRGFLSKHHSKHPMSLIESWMKLYYVVILYKRLCPDLVSQALLTHPRHHSLLSSFLSQNICFSFCLRKITRHFSFLYQMFILHRQSDRSVCVWS